jgi:hypothetical protein
MNQSDLRPASSFALNYGVKMLAYGGPGTGKTPLAESAPRPVLLACETGLLSMRHSNLPTWQGTTPAAIDEFMRWIELSAESRNFDTVCIDSAAQMAVIYLQPALIKHKHGMKAYGDMAESTLKHLQTLYYMRQKHVYLIMQEGIEEVGVIKRYRPSFPGQQLNKDVPHLYDEIVRLERVQVPTSPKPVVGMRTAESFEAMARDRSGKLAEMELPIQGQPYLNLSHIFSKCMAA